MTHADEPAGFNTQQRLAHLLEEVSSEIYVFDARTLRLTEANHGALRNIGYTLDELREVTPLDLKTELAPASFAALLAPLRTGQREQVAFEAVHQRKDGSRYPVEVRVHLRAEETPPVFVAVIQEISERVVMQEALRRSEHNLAEAQRIAHVGSWERNVETGALRWSDESHRIFGIEPGSFGGTIDEFLAMVHPEDRGKVAPTAATFAALGRRTVDYRIIRADGTERVVHEEGEVVRDDQGLPIRYIGTTQDITERVGLEDELRRSQRTLADAQRIAHIGSWERDAASDALHLSDEMCRTFGIEPGTFAGTNDAYMALIHPDDRAPIEEAERAALEDGAPYRFDYRIVRPDGTVRIVHEDGEVVRDEAGRPVRMIGTTQDITDRLAREEERTRLMSAVEQTADSVWIHELDGTILYVNPSFTRLYGYQQDEVLGHYMGILDSGRHATSFWDELFATVLTGQTWSGTIVNQRKDGTVVEVEKVISAIRDSDGRITGVVQSDRDVSRERALEAQLRQAQKMEAVGQLAGGIAHDFNNLLTAIRGYGELVRRGLPADDEQNRADIDEVIANADRAVELTRDLLAFGRQQVFQPRVTDLAMVVAGIVPMLRRLLGEQIEVVTAALPGLGSVKVDPGQLEQVIVNLAVNARDAMPTGGRLAIETANVEVDTVYARAHIDIAAGPYVLLTVSDTGTGMDAAVQAHIFEPFFTTKAPGEGTGLGLATVYGIVQQSGGSIQVQSEPGQGTTFRIYLPRVEAASELADPNPQEGPTAAGTETILLVEDDETVRLFAARALADCGYRVLEAPDAETALTVAAAHDGPLDLLVTDVVMPRVTGPQLAERLARERPLTRVLYISGYTEHGLGRSGALGPASAYLAKPFTAEVLAQTVREVLERPSGHREVGS